MRTTTYTHLAGKHCFYGDGDPFNYDPPRYGKLGGWKVLTFSVRIFRWELSSDGKKCKSGPTICRISGRSNQAGAEAVRAKAKSIVEMLDSGEEYTGPKRMRVG